MSDDTGDEKQEDKGHAQSSGPVDAMVGDLEAQAPSFLHGAGPSDRIDDDNNERPAFGAPVMDVSYRVGLNDEGGRDGGADASNTAANDMTIDGNVPQSVRKWLETQQQREDHGTTGAANSTIVQSAMSGGATAAATRPQAARRQSMHSVNSIASLKSLAMQSATSVGSTRNVLSTAENSDADDMSLSSDANVDPHTKAFRDAIESAGLNAFGIIGADVWIHDEDDGSFHHTPGGYWRHPRYQPNNVLAQIALARVEDIDRKDFVPPTRQIPGAGLAGYFWQLCSHHDHHCTWRDVRAITSDPDQPPYLRMQMLEQAGFGKATGVPFDIRGHRGVVLYLARESASEAQLLELSNDCHLRVSADIIGGVSARSITQEACKTLKAARTAATLRRLRAKFLAIAAFTKHCGKNDSSEDHLPPSIVDFKSEEAERLSSLQKLSASVGAKMRKSYRQSLAAEISDALKHKARVTLTKCKGGGMTPPPSMPFRQVVWTFLGAFITLMILGGLNVVLSKETGYGILLPPFGALLTLQYGLTPAPASQPRNAIYGQVIAISLALLVKVITVNMTHTWIRVPLATSLAIAFMARLGILHPPAGASAALFASQDRFDGIFFALMLFGNLIAILTAIVINNLNDKRQYPIYYAFVSDGFIDRVLSTFDACIPYCQRKKLSREEDLDRTRHALDKSLRTSLREFNRQKPPF